MILATGVRDVAVTALSIFYCLAAAVFLPTTSMLSFCVSCVNFKVCAPS